MPRTPAEWVLAAALALQAWWIAQNILFHPVAAIDDHSYAGRALYFLHDQRLDLGIYHWPSPPGTSSNLYYPPLYSLALAIPHALGSWQPKVVNVFFALAWPLLLYGALREHLPRVPAMLWIFFLALTPEIYSMSSFALLNMPAMVLTTGVALALGRFLEMRSRGELVLAAILGAAAAGIRPDAVVVHATLCGLALLVVFRGAGLREWIGIALVGLAPLLTWGTWSVFVRTGIGLAPPPRSPGRTRSACPLSSARPGRRCSPGDCSAGCSFSGR